MKYTPFILSGHSKTMEKYHKECNLQINSKLSFPWRHMQDFESQKENLNVQMGEDNWNQSTGQMKALSWKKNSKTFAKIYWDLKKQNKQNETIMCKIKIAFSTHFG